MKWKLLWFFAQLTTCQVSTCPAQSACAQEGGPGWAWGSIPAVLDESAGGGGPAQVLLQYCSGDRDPGRRLLSLGEVNVKGTEEGTGRDDLQ